METMHFYLVLISALMWWGLLLIPWRPSAAAPFLEADDQPPQDIDLSDITVLIPARNEADTIAVTLNAVNAQGHNLKVVMVDDQSTDGTARIALATLNRLCLVSGETLPDGWSGKLWALEQGRERVMTPLTLLLDADIALQPGTLAALRKALKQDDLGLISLMAMPPMKRFWERLLMPAFIYFFKLLYPFRLSNSRFPGIAAAAGGCILVRTELLTDIGGFAALKGALIDDCSLARIIKARGERIWIGLTHAARSQRPYTGLGQIWAMVARTAYTQLKYSVLLLMVCTLLMMFAFWVPLAGFFSADNPIECLSLAAFAAMLVSYQPVLKFYGRSSAWALCLPLIGTLYLAMTWSSAWRYWRGERATWKERIYPLTSVTTSPSTETETTYMSGKGAESKHQS